MVVEVEAEAVAVEVVASASRFSTLFKIFQTRILEEYDRIIPEYGLTVIDASQSIGEQQRLVRSLLDEMYGFPATPAAPETIDAAALGAEESAA